MRNRTSAAVRAVCALFSLLLWAAGPPALGAEPLLPLGADAAPLTVSGVSSGAYMAVQMHVAHSRSVRGAGVIGGGPYYCAQGSLATARYNCMTPGYFTPLPRVEHLKSLTDSLAAVGQIDPTENLAQSRAWLFTGTRDRTVQSDVVTALRAYYRLFNVDPVLVADKPAGHAMVTEAAGNPCPVTEPPYINDCDYDAAGELLQHLLGPLRVPAGEQSGRIVRFNQDEFAAGNASSIGLAKEGFFYLPKACETGGCRVHVAFHGCRQNARAVAERFIREAGYNRWADANRLIVLYPQTVNRYFPIFNPRGCWDWWGYTGPQYPTKAGAQIRAVKAMADRLAAPSK